MADRSAAATGTEVDASLGPQAVHRALEVLTYVVDNGPLALSDIARASKLPTSTTLRMLRALEHWGYVSRSAGSQYSVGQRFVESRVAYEPARAEDLLDLSADIMQRVTQATSESSYLAVPGPARTCTFLREVQSPLPIRHVGFDGWTGRTVAMSGSAAGEIFDRRTPPIGYVVMGAVEDSDATVIGAPINDANGSPIAALSIAAPTFRLNPDIIARFGELVAIAAQELAERLDAQSAVR